MNRNQVNGQIDKQLVQSVSMKMRTYVLPAIEIIAVRSEGLLNNASGSGGHNPVKDDEILNAKGFSVFEEEEEK